MAKIFKTSLFSGRILLRSEIDSPNALAKKEVVMVTINDVARLAKVSRGTVSNVINGKNNVSLEKIKRVEEAIRILGYQPNARARSLKTNRSNSIGVVLPNIYDNRYAALYSTIERMFTDKGYIVTLYITSELPAKENRIIELILQQKMDGLIIITCQPQNRELWQRLNAAKIPAVFIEREIESKNYNLIKFNYKEVLYEVTKELLYKKHNKIALITGPIEYSSEKQSIDGYCQALEEAGIGSKTDFIKISQNNKESAFRQSIELLHSSAELSAIITTSEILAEGALKAVDIYKHQYKSPPQIISILDDSWTNQSYSQIGKIFQPSSSAAELAAQILLDSMENPENTSPIVKALNMQFNETPPFENALNPYYVQHNDKTLKVLMLDSTAAKATKKLIPDFFKKINSKVKVEFTELDYKSLYNVLQKPPDVIDYDVIEVDLPWLPEMVIDDKLLPIDDLIAQNPKCIESLIPGILNTYAKYDDRFYVLPFVYGTQLLFYRKDLFENQQIQRHFFEMYGKKLSPPTDWKEYNLIAKFFTKKYNPHSPVPYGTTLGGRYTTGSVCEFLPRNWAFGGRIFSENNEVVFYSQQSIKALVNYCEAFKYASPNSCYHWWDEQVLEFSKGEAAMMVLFAAHATDIADRNKSVVAGNVGYATIPGSFSLLGGWSLGINKLSKQKELAFEFISWACSKELAVPYTVLGGATPHVKLYQSPELLSVYPWLPKALEAFKISKKRSLPRNENTVMRYGDFERILGGAVYSAITGKLSPEEAILNAHKQFEKLCCQTKSIE